MGRVEDYRLEGVGIRRRGIVVRLDLRAGVYTLSALRRDMNWRITEMLVDRLCRLKLRVDSVRLVRIGRIPLLCLVALGGIAVLLGIGVMLCEGLPGIIGLSGDIAFGRDIGVAGTEQEVLLGQTLAVLWGIGDERQRGVHAFRPGHKAEVVEALSDGSLYNVSMASAEGAHQCGASSQR